MNPEDKTRFDAIYDAVSHGAVEHEPEIANDMMFLCALVRGSLAERDACVVRENTWADLSKFWRDTALRLNEAHLELRAVSNAWREAADGLRWHMDNPPELEVLEPEAHALEVTYQAEYEPSETVRSFRTSRTAALIALRGAWKKAAHPYSEHTDDALALDGEYQLDYGPFEDEPTMTDKQKNCAGDGAS